MHLQRETKIFKESSFEEGILFHCICIMNFLCLEHFLISIKRRKEVILNFNINGSLYNIIVHNCFKVRIQMSIHVSLVFDFMVNTN